MYRSDLAAAHARIAALEDELARANTDLARHTGPCRSPEHAARMRQLGELEKRLAKANAAAVPPEQVELERRLNELTNELRDLALLQKGDAAMNAEIDACYAEISALEGSAVTRPIPPVAIARTWRDTPMALATIVGAATFATAATAFGALASTAIGLAMWWGTYAPAGRMPRPRETIDGIAFLDVPWRRVRELRFLPNGTLQVRYGIWRTAWFYPHQPHYAAAVATILAAAEHHKLRVDGAPRPALPEGA
jgi:hypothetical protein